MQRALAKKPEQRYASVGAFVEALSPVVAIGAAAVVAVLVALWIGTRHAEPSGTIAASSPAVAESIPAPSSPAPPLPVLTATPAPPEAPPTPRPPKATAPAAGAPIALPVPRRPPPVAPAAASPTPAPRPTGRAQPEGAGLGERGILKLVIEPDAEVFIDEVYMGSAHARSDTLPAGPHLLRLEREGFRSVDTTVTVGAAQVVRVEFRLKKS